MFSGTLSFLFNTFSTPPTASASATADDPNTPPTARRSFSSIVHEAKAAGYTEPDPRDDLNGMDVARKVVILSRVAGLDLALETLPVENVVPEALRGCRTAEEFMRRLDECDGWFERMNEEAGARGEVLRYVGVVSDRGDVPSEVALRRYYSSCCDCHVGCCRLRQPTLAR